jgi:glucokinase
VGIGMAGQIDGATGTVRFAPNLGWREVPLRADIEVALDVPVIVTNDVRAAMWGEWLHGAGKGYDDVLSLFVGTGIGGGVVSNGRIVAGCANTAGEFGHITIELKGPLCTCGNQGCLEALAGGWAIARQAQDMVREAPEAGRALLTAAGGAPEGISAATVAGCAHAGDPLSLLLVDRVGRALVAGCVSLVNAFNPCMVILGGGVIEGLPELVGKVREGVKSKALPAATASLEVRPAALGGSAGVVGAASLVLSASPGGTGTVEASL